MTEQTPQTVGDIIMEMMDALDTHGWCQGKRRNDQGQMCAMGALDYVWMNSPNRDELHPGLWEDVVDQLSKHANAFNEENISVWLYNDYCVYDISDVREWFTKAAMDAGVSDV